MAFKRKRKVYKLDFSGTEYDGLEVRVSGLTTGEFLEVVMLGATDKDSNETEKTIQLLAKHLISWNLEDEDDNPVPPTYEGLKSVDFSMALYISNAWTDAIINVSEETEKKSRSGETFLAESIPSMAL